MRTRGGRLRLVFWQLLESPHQAPFIRELASMLGHGGVTCVFDKPLDSTTRREGWSGHDASYGTAEIIYSRGNGLAVAQSLASDSSRVHMFSSLCVDAGIRAAFAECATRKLRLGLLSEARDWRGWRGTLRKLDSLRYERAWRDKLAFVLAMGTLGREWFHRCGYDDERIFDFCYVVETPSALPRERLLDGGLRLLFVGQLIERKRVDLLLRAFSKLAGRNVSLDIVGTGPLDKSLKELAANLRLGDSVRFLGGVPNAEVNTLLSSADVLVLPSYWDGWGAVVNEALANGARVICSDYCGAADLIRNPAVGSIFTEGSLDSLAQALDANVRIGPVSTLDRRRIRDYSKSFAGPSVAEYLLRVLDWTHSGTGPRPVAPWRQMHFEVPSLAAR